MWDEERYFLPLPPKSSKKYGRYTSIESDWIRFKWFNIDELDNIEIHPKNIVNMIKNETNHIIEKIDM